MKKSLLLALSLFVTGCGVSFTYNGLQCPTDDMGQIQRDLSECKVYNTKEVDKAFNQNKECRECLEDKGYRVEGSLDNNASN